MNISPPSSNQINTPILDPIIEGLSLLEDSSIEKEFYSNKDPYVIELSSSSSELEISSKNRTPSINYEHTPHEPYFGEVWTYIELK